MFLIFRQRRRSKTLDIFYFVDQKLTESHPLSIENILQTSRRYVIIWIEPDCNFRKCVSIATTITTFGEIYHSAPFCFTQGAQGG